MYLTLITCMTYNGGLELPQLTGGLQRISNTITVTELNGTSNGHFSSSKCGSQKEVAAKDISGPWSLKSLLPP